MSTSPASVVHFTSLSVAVKRFLGSNLEFKIEEFGENTFCYPLVHLRERELSIPENGLQNS